jgi:hypothetical protein
VAAILALGAALALVMSAEASHVRPKGATPLRVPLVPSYQQCTAPNRAHGAPLAYGSCIPPKLTTNQYLTLGTPDANGAGANSSGSLLIQALQADIRFTLQVTDVRCGPNAVSSVCPNPNSAGAPDYSGDLLATVGFRVSDHSNGSGGDEALTMTDLSWPVEAQCAVTASAAIGGQCSGTTTVNAFAPGAVMAGRRAVWEVAQVVLYDAGADGDIHMGDGAGTWFMKQGVFIP